MAICPLRDSPTFVRIQRPPRPPICLESWQRIQTISNCFLDRLFENQFAFFLFCGPHTQRVCHCRAAGGGGGASEVMSSGGRLCFQVQSIGVAMDASDSEDDAYTERTALVQSENPAVPSYRPDERSQKTVNGHWALGVSQKTLRPPKRIDPTRIQSQANQSKCF